MLRNFLLFIFVIAFFQSTTAQVATGQEIKKVFQKGIDFYEKAQLDSAAFYFEKARELAYQTKTPSYWKGQTTNFLSLSLIESDTARSRLLFEAAVENTKQLSARNGNVSKQYLDRGGVYRKRGDRMKATKYYQTGYEFIKTHLEDEGDSNTLLIFLRELVDFHLEVGDTESALEELDDSLIPNGTRNYEPFQAYGDVYMELKEFEKALEYFVLALEHQKRDIAYTLKQGDQTDIEALPTDSAALGNRMNSMAEAYLAMKNLGLAKVYLDSSAFYLADNSDDQVLLANDMAKWALISQDYVSAQTYLNQVAEGLNSLNKQEEWQQMYTSQEELAAATGDFDNYKFWRDKKDSLDRLVFEEGRLNVVNAQNDLFRAEEKQVRLAQENALLRSKNVNILMGIGLAALASLVYYFVFVSKKMRLLSERNELLVREQNHRVKNNLQMINSLLSLQAGRLKDEQGKKVLQQSQSRIQVISLLNRSLYEQEDISNVDLKNYIVGLVKEVINSVTDDKVNAIVNVADIELNVDKATSLGLIINELIVNSVKHSKAGQADFKLLIQQQKGQIELHYKDNNKGFDLEQYRRSRSFGKRLIELQAKQIKGQLEIEDTDQFELLLAFN